MCIRCGARFFQNRLAEMDLPLEETRREVCQPWTILLNQQGQPHPGFSPAPPRQKKQEFPPQHAEPQAMRVCLIQRCCPSPDAACAASPLSEQKRHWAATIVNLPPWILLRPTWRRATRHPKPRCPASRSSCHQTRKIPVRRKPPRTNPPPRFPDPLACCQTDLSQGAETKNQQTYRQNFPRHPGIPARVCRQAANRAKTDFDRDLEPGTHRGRCGTLLQILPPLSGEGNYCGKTTMYLHQTVPEKRCWPLLSASCQLR